MDGKLGGGWSLLADENATSDWHFLHLFICICCWCCGSRTKTKRRPAKYKRHASPNVWFLPLPINPTEQEQTPDATGTARRLRYAFVGPFDPLNCFRNVHDALDAPGNQLLNARVFLLHLCFLKSVLNKPKWCKCAQSWLLVRRQMLTFEGYNFQQHFHYHPLLDHAPCTSTSAWN